MISKTKIKELHSLKSKKFRQKYQLFLAEGVKVVTALLDHKKELIKEVIADASWITNNRDKINGIYVEEAHSRELTKISSLKTSPSVIAVVHLPQQTLREGAHIDRAFYLDDVQDPGNVGTIIRIADWYGVDTVIRSPESADFYNPKVIQATMGSFANVNLWTQDFEALQDSYSDNQYIATTITGKKLQECTHSGGEIIVLGNEGSGIRPHIVELCEYEVSIEGSSHRQADSLNVAISAGILAQHFWGEQ